MRLRERVVGGLELREFRMLSAAVLGELFGLGCKFCSAALGLCLGQFQLLGERLQLELGGFQ